MWHSKRLARKHFHAVRLSRSSFPMPVAAGAPLLFVANHPSWWDVIIGFVLFERFPHYQHFVPIDASMLSKYRFFNRLGFFGIDGTPRGAACFLRTSKTILESPFRAMWVTAQGKFVDPRARPIELQPGVGHVAARLPAGFIIPVALEYPFWDECTPEALVRFGEPLDLAAERGLDGRALTARIETALTCTQDALAVEAMRRDPSAFEVLVAGRVGVGGFYDCWRRCKAWLRGRRFDAAHTEPPVDAKTEGGPA
jgi:1-acyl-sn-glycerol-3-phosphate acyltransferase